MGELTLLKSMLLLVEQRLAQSREGEGLTPQDAAVAEGLDPNSPEAMFLGYLDSLGPAELEAFRQEICLGALQEIDAQFAELEGG